MQVCLGGGEAGGGGWQTPLGNSDHRAGAARATSCGAATDPALAFPIGVRRSPTRARRVLEGDISKVRQKLLKFLLRRPTHKSLREKGYIKGTRGTPEKRGASGPEAGGADSLSQTRCSAVRWPSCVALRRAPVPRFVRRASRAVETGYVTAPAGHSEPERPPSRTPGRRPPREGGGAGSRGKSESFRAGIRARALARQATEPGVSASLRSGAGHRRSVPHQWEPGHHPEAAL